MKLHAVLPSLVLALGCATGLAQVTPQPPATVELPVVLRQDVKAGKTPVGTKIEAKLSVATLIEHIVVPRNATLQGEVVESEKKTSSSPSKLAIRIDSAQWKDGSMQLKAYLTSWIYPTVEEGGQNLQYGPDQGSRNWNGQGQYPNSSRGYKPFPGSDDKESGVPDTPASVASHHRVQMKEITEENLGDGMALVSTRSDIKLDRYTTYVLASSAQPAPAQPAQAQK